MLESDFKFYYLTSDTGGSFLLLRVNPGCLELSLDLEDDEELEEIFECVEGWKVPCVDGESVVVAFRAESDLSTVLGSRDLEDDVELGEIFEGVECWKVPCVDEEDVSFDLGFNRLFDESDFGTALGSRGVISFCVVCCLRTCSS